MHTYTYLSKDVVVQCSAPNPEQKLCKLCDLLWCIFSYKCEVIFSQYPYDFLPTPVISTIRGLDYINQAFFILPQAINSAPLFPIMRICTRCQQSKPDDAFTRLRPRGFYATCSRCRMMTRETQARNRQNALLRQVAPITGPVTVRIPPLDTLHLNKSGINSSFYSVN